MTDLLIATQNKGKLHEYRRLLANLRVTLRAPDEVGLGRVDVDETGDTFAANAAIKAQAFARASGLLALADDSGLVVDALDGRPGVHSARYGGPGLDDAGRRDRLLSELEAFDDDQRSAHFACVIAIAAPDSETVHSVTGTCPGRIIRAARGTGGFGYDPIFVPDGYDQTFAELPLDVKNAISHRALAATAAIPLLREILTG